MIKKIKILYIIPANIDEGNQIVYSSFIKNEIDSISKNDIVLEILKYYFVRRIEPKDIINSIVEFKKIIKTYQPDIIHSQVGSITSFVAAISRGNIKLVTTFGGSDLLGMKRENFYWKARSRISKFLSDYGINNSDGIICVSSNLYNFLGLEGQNKSVIIPRGIDLSSFKLIEVSSARNKLGWDSEEKVILFNNSNASSYVKNLPLAIEAVNQLNDGGILTARLEILENMNKDDVVIRMNAANVLLVTSFHEGSPNIVKESMACNLPIVSVNVGDVAERIENCNISKIVSNNSKDIVNALKSVLIQNERSNGREIIIRDEISNIKTSQKIIDFYQKVLN